jgi:hypothetical protein
MITIEQQTVKALGHEIVADLAPRELPLFEPISQAWFENPARVRSGTGSDEPLGFGLGEFSTYMTPVILTVATRVVEVLAKDIGHALVNATADRIAELIRAWLIHKKPALTSEQIVHIREAVLDAMGGKGLTNEDMQKVAGRVTTTLGGEAKNT